MKNTAEQKILLIEDNSGDVRMVTEMLIQITSIHYHLTVVETLKDGCEQIKKNNFSLILLDLNLPDSTGKQTFDTVIKIAGNIPVVTLSGLQDEELAISLIKEGSQDYIAKKDLYSSLLAKAIQYALIRKKTEVELKASKDYLNKIIDAVGSPIFVKNDKHKLTLVNAAFCKLLNLPPEELIGLNGYELFPKEQADIFIAKDQEVLNTGIENTNEELVTDGQGMIRTFITRRSLYADTSGNKFLVGVGNDITEHKQMQVASLNMLEDIKTEFEARTKSEERYKTLFEKASEGILFLSETGKALGANESFAAMHGYSITELLTMDIRTLDTPEMRELLPELFARVLGGEQLRFETAHYHKDGSIIYFAVSTSLINLGNEKFIQAFHTDITERKEQEEERIKIVEDIIKRNKDLEQFSYIISHNLRAPVANIMGLSTAIESENLTPEMRKKFIAGLSNSVNKLDDVINDLNDILRVNQQVNERKELVIFSKLANDIHSSIESTIEKETACIVLDFSEVDEMLTFKSYLHSIFYNLILNSIKYRQLSIVPIIEIKSRLLKDKIVLTFKDNGRGIDLKTKGNQVFGLYKRFHTEVTEGKGMGLYMVKTQVEAIGGKISIESEVNKGTTFTIEFDN